MPKSITKEALDSYLLELQKNPNRFIREVLGNSPTINQSDIGDAVANNQRVTIRSCHGPGKTFYLARLALWFLYCYPPSIVISTAPTFRQVKEIMWRYVGRAHSSSTVPLSGHINQTSITLGPDWYAAGFSAKHGEKFQGFHSPNIMFIVDEAAGVEEKIFEAINANLSGGNIRLIYIGNPTSNSGNFAASFKDPDFFKMKISVFDTPNFVDNGLKSIDDIKAAIASGRSLKIIPGLVSPDWALKMANKYGEDSDIYRVRVLGDFPILDSDSLVSVDDIERAFNREEVEPNGVKIIGVDPARFGNDRTVILLRQGNYVHDDILKLSKANAMTVAGNIIAFAKKHEVRPSDIHIDEVGLGAGIVDRLVELGFDVRGVNVGKKASDDEIYLNQRSEGMFELKNAMRDIRLPRDDDFYQLSNIKFSYNSRGQRVIMPKEEYRKKFGGSPDIVDALMITYLSGKHYEAIFDVIDDEDGDDELDDDEQYLTPPPEPKKDEDEEEEN